MGAREIVIIAVIVVLLFGAPKLPELARSIGKSMRILKDETKSLASDDTSDQKKDDAAHVDGESASRSADDETRGK